MKILVLSDLHNEFAPFLPPVTNVDVAVLAGDIDVKTRGVTWAAEHFDCPVLYVPGNHEYYGGQLVHSLRKLREAAAATPNVKILDRDEVIIDDVRFLGATAWTDYNATGNAPMAAIYARQELKDFKKIRTERYGKVDPNDFAKEAQATKAWFREKFSQPFSGHTVGITHHAPTTEALKGHPEAGTHLDAAFANRWEELFGEWVDLFIHGHNHQRSEFELYGTRIVSNQRGYPGEIIDFDPGFIIDTNTFRTKA